MIEEARHIWEILEQVPDPEIPVLTVVDLGIIRGVEMKAGGVAVTITPTYSGCPAMDFIAVNIKATLAEHGYSNAQIHTVLSPAWTTDWLSDAGRRKLKEYGIAPPEKGLSDKGLLFQPEKRIPCPRCSASDTELVSQFGSTPCKALYKCRVCLEPFDYFKCH